MDLGIFDVPGEGGGDEEDYDQDPGVIEEPIFGDRAAPSPTYNRRVSTAAPARPGAYGPPPAQPVQATAVPASPKAASARTDVGVAMIWTGIGLASGAALLGPFGALAGASVVGSVRNGYRAYKDWSSPDPISRQEASKSATVALFGAGIAGMLAFAAVTSKDNKDG